MKPTENKKSGIDVSVYQGKICWSEVRASGTDFVMIKATQGRSEQNPAVRLFTDSRFRANIIGASSWGLRCGVYHYLTASTPQEAIEEARYFLSVIAPFRDDIRLYAAVDVESEQYLPKTRQERTAVVHTFCNVVAQAGYDAAVYTNPDYLTNKLGNLRKWKLWLALWRGKDQIPSAAQYPNLVLWQWGSAQTGGIHGKVDQNLEIQPKKHPVKPIPAVPASYYADTVCARAELSESTRAFLSLYKYEEALWEKLYHAITENDRPEKIEKKD